MGLETSIVELSIKPAKIWQITEFYYPWLNLHKIALGTYCQLFNIANRFPHMFPI